MSRYITAVDLKRGVAALNIEADAGELDDMVREADETGDGRVNFEECKTIATYF